jgi:hypothetical protein
LRDQRYMAVLFAASGGRFAEIRILISRQF